MDRIKYWRATSEKLLCYIYSLQLKPIDIYLVGSGARGSTTTTSDIDSIILIEDNIPIDALKDIRKQLYEHLCIVNGPSLYHFKLFNLREIHLLGLYDGFRLFEFQLSYMCLHETRNLIELTPTISLNTFCNSIFIQTVYEFLNNKETYQSGDEVITAKVNERIIRNNVLCERAGLNINLSFDHAIYVLHSQDKLFARFWHIGANPSVDSKILFSFMHQYFKRFRHEYVNKYYTYTNIINRRQMNENKTPPHRNRYTRDSSKRQKNTSCLLKA